CVSPSSSLYTLFFNITRRQPRYTLFPYTTLFRSMPSIVGLAARAPVDQVALELLAAAIRPKSMEIVPDDLPPDRALRCVLDKPPDRKSTRLNSSHVKISYAVFCLKKKKQKNIRKH